MDDFKGSDSETDRGWSPPLTAFTLHVMVDHSEGMLFSALRQLADKNQFSAMKSSAKARVFSHLADMYRDE